MSEWPKETVLKTVDAKASGGSNPPLSVHIKKKDYYDYILLGRIGGNGVCSYQSRKRTSAVHTVHLLYR